MFSLLSIKKYGATRLMKRLFICNYLELIIKKDYDCEGAEMVFQNKGKKKRMASTSFHCWPR